MPITTKVGEQQETIECFKRVNEALLGESHIERLRWLGKKDKEKTVSGLIIEFTDPEAANDVIRAERITWEGNPKKTQRYSKDCQSTQCFCCHGYNHTQASCTKKPVCGYCSSPQHGTKDHPDKNDKTGLKCPNCGHQHTAWSHECHHKQAEINRIIAAKKELQANPFFPIPGRVTPGVSAYNTRAPSPAEAQSEAHLNESAQMTGRTTPEQSDGGADIPSSPPQLPDMPRKETAIPPPTARVGNRAIESLKTPAAKVISFQSSPLKPADTVDHGDEWKEAPLRRKRKMPVPVAVPVKTVAKQYERLGAIPPSIKASTGLDGKVTSTSSVSRRLFHPQTEASGSTPSNTGTKQTFAPLPAHKRASSSLFKPAKVIFKSPNREITPVHEVETVATRRSSSSDSTDSPAEENQSKASSGKASSASPAESSGASASTGDSDNRRRILRSKSAQPTTTTDP